MEQEEDIRSKKSLRLLSFERRAVASPRKVDMVAEDKHPLAGLMSAVAAVAIGNLQKIKTPSR